jgi:hypothetical protein
MENESFIIVPRGNPGLKALQLNMQDVTVAEQRIGEIAYMTSQKAPELLSVFNRAFLELTRMLAWLEMESGSASRHVNLRRSELLLDIAPRVLADRGLATSKDLRDAVVDSDVQYQECLERQGTIKAYQELLKGKSKALEMAYTSVKKILGERPMGGGGGYNPNVHTPEQRESLDEPGQNESRPTSGFTKARY